MYFNVPGFSGMCLMYHQSIFHNHIIHFYFDYSLKNIWTVFKLSYFVMWFTFNHLYIYIFLII